MPARIFNLPGGTLARGAAADVVVLDPTAQWTVEPDEFFSKSRNTPFGGRRLRGRADVTIVRGQVVFRRVQGEPEPCTDPTSPARSCSAAGGCGRRG